MYPLSSYYYMFLRVSEFSHSEVFHGTTLFQQLFLAYFRGWMV
jgi:hypothetical protein